MALTTDDINAYLGIDYEDDATEANRDRCFASAQELVRSSIGADVYELLFNDSKVDELTLIYTDELYSNRGMESGKMNSSVRRIVDYLELNLRSELRKARESV